MGVCQLGCYLEVSARIAESCALLLPGPPDAPLDVQIEPGPSPGIVVISWLPVTIDAAGTSNGVRVTGYAIYADGQKVRPGDSASLCPGNRMGASPCRTQRLSLPSLAHRCPAPGRWAPWSQQIG